jgi:hypothetical protein
MGHVTCLGQMRTAHALWSDNLKGRDHLMDHGVLGRVAIKFILQE